MTLIVSLYVRRWLVVTNDLVCFIQKSNFGTKNHHQTFEQEMNAFRNLVAYFNPSNPSSDALEERSSAPRDGGDSLSSQQGEYLHGKIIFILQFCTNMTIA